MAPVLEVADIFRRHGEAFRQAHAGHLGCVERRIMGAITACRTAALGGHVEQCDDCGATRIAYNSCRNRHCPKCQGAARERWLAERRGEVLPIPYFHVVFTLPPAPAEIAFQNKAAVYAEETCQGTDGQEEPRLAGHPALSIERGSAARYDAMDVGMMLECLPPGMEDGEDAEFGFEMARIGGELHQCRSGGTEQDGGMFLAELGAAFEAGDLKFFGDLTRLAAPQAFAQRLADLRGADWVVYAKPPFG